MRKKAFTLAEVLITLAIIGVIAAISVPSLIQKTNQAELITAWKKGFATISQGASQYAFEAGSIPKYSKGSDYANAFGNYLKIVKKCEVTNIEDNCWHANGKWTIYNGNARSEVMNGDTRYGAFVLSNGSLVYIFTDSYYTCPSSSTISSSDYTNDGKSCMHIHLDINGFKSPNTIGKDIYGAILYSDGTLTPLSKDINSVWACDTATAGNDAGWGCSAESLYKK